jgi:hypothetical protein
MQIGHSWTAKVLAIIIAGSSASSCNIEDDMPPPTYVDGYEPQLYDGYVVYYDGIGRPFYYVGGAPMWVPVTSPFYGRLVAHWHTYGFAYNRWNARYGHRYRGYRTGGRRR